MKVEELSKYGISEEFVQKFKEEKIFELFPPQEEIVKKRLFKDRNLVISLPTAGGKTLIAALAMINKLSKTRCKVVYTVPLVALANEKFNYFKKLFEKKWKVAISVGELDSSDPWLANYDVIICTNEKMDSLIRHGATWIKDIGLIVVDEIHLLNDPRRGPTLEILLTQLKEIVPRAQILALSATINNAAELAKWLNAVLVVSDFRPVKLYEGIFYDSKISFFGRKGYELSGLEPEAAIAENVMQLKKQVLYFVATRRTAESLAEKLTKTVQSYLKRQEERELHELADKIQNVLEVPTKQCRKLAACIKHGVTFHHAGLLGTQKRLIEEKFREGLIKAIVATPTLCLHPDTLVITKDCVKKIVELKQGDLVMTHEGRFKKVISPLERDFKGKLLIINLFGGIDVKMTPEHRVLVVKQIRHKSHYSDGRQKIWWEYSKPNWLKISEIHRRFKCKDKKTSFILLQPIPPANVCCDKIPLKTKDSFVSNQYGPANRIHPANYKTPKYLPLDYEISRLIGIWVAEGSTTKTGAIIFDIATYEESLTNFIATIIKKYFLKSNVSIKDKERHRRRIIFCNKAFEGWLRENIGHAASLKRIPDTLLFNKSRNVRLGIFKGLIDGDGYIRIDNKTRASYISYSTSSPSLAYQLQILLASLGYVSSISSRKNYNSNIIYTVKVSGRSFYTILNELAINMNQKIGNRIYNINKLKDNYLLLKIKEIKEENYSGKVYNLSVVNDESYSVGFIVHNSLGVNLPAFRVVIRDAKRYYSGIGMTYIPVLEYKQFVGRAGRPTYDDFGESVLIARTEEDAHDLTDRFIMGQPEDIQSKLAIEPILRMHTLALIATEFCASENSLYDFFSKTFYAHQFGDISLMEEKLEGIIGELEEWKFVLRKNEKLLATRIGKRISELYIDPLTAHQFVESLTKNKDSIHAFGLLQAISNTIEMRPLLSVRTGEFSEIEDELVRRENQLLQEIPDETEFEFDEFLKSLKTALMFEAWIEESTEDQILTKFKVAPGEFYGRREIADWLVYSMQELSLLLGYKEILKDIRKLRIRLQYGIREELLPLIRLKQVGRIRARKLFNSGIKTLDALRKTPTERLSNIVGLAVAKNIGDQLKGKKELKKESQQNLKKFDGVAGI